MRLQLLQTGLKWGLDPISASSSSNRARAHKPIGHVLKQGLYSIGLRVLGQAASLVLSSP